MLIKGVTLISAVGAVLALMGDLGILGALGVFAAMWLGLALVVFLFLLFLCALVDIDKPQEEDSLFYRAMLYLYIEALIPLVGIRLRTQGLEKTPQTGRFLLVCNHQNESDVGLLLHCFKKSRVSFISKKENRGMFIVGKFMHKTLAQMIDRENDRKALLTIKECIRLIQIDHVSIGGFPEGGIKEEYKLTPFRSGMFRIAKKAGVPVVVCTLKGTTDLFRNMKRLRFTDIDLHLVDVIPAETVAEKTTVEIAGMAYEMMISDLGEDWRLGAMDN